MEIDSFCIPLGFWAFKTYSSHLPDVFPKCGSPQLHWPFHMLRESWNWFQNDLGSWRYSNTETDRSNYMLALGFSKHLVLNYQCFMQSLKYLQTLLNLCRSILPRQSFKCPHMIILAHPKIHLHLVMSFISSSSPATCKTGKTQYCNKAPGTHLPSPRCP